jgi:hypothetical protein
LKPKREILDYVLRSEVTYRYLTVINIGDAVFTTSEAVLKRLEIRESQPIGMLYMLEDSSQGFRGWTFEETTKQRRFFLAFFIPPTR